MEKGTFPRTRGSAKDDKLLRRLLLEDGGLGVGLGEGEVGEVEVAFEFPGLKAEEELLGCQEFYTHVVGEVAIAAAEVLRCAERTISTLQLCYPPAGISDVEAILHVDVFGLQVVVF